MPRRPRVFVPGAIYHLYCRVGRGERVFTDARAVAGFLAIVREVMSIHDFQVFAWCIMPTHYHMALRTGEIPLWQSLRLIQGRFAQAYNRQHGVLGSLWQERYKAKLVLSDEYLKQLIAYIHLNPVRSGLSSDPRGYEWSGHRGLTSRAGDGLVDRDETMQLFADTPAAARSAYLATVASVAGSSWAAAEPGRLPWWQREPREDAPPPRAHAPRPRLDALGASSTRERPQLDAAGFVGRACLALGVEPEHLAGASRVHPMVRTRDLVAALAVERYALRSADLASVLRRSPDHVSRWVSRGAHRRLHDPDFAAELDSLDEAVAEEEGRPGAAHNL